ncbi:AMP-binding protein [Streptomyces chartreusis]|uniref:AMP-binding protein n=1 Tax=Streptomyces chartreusis TaxID=1969 RepID=UPI0037F4A0F8
MTNLAAALAESAGAHGDRIAARQDDTVLTCTQLDGAATRVAALLREKGARPGDRVALVMPNVTLFPVAYYGILRAGYVVVPANPLLKSREVAHTLRDSGTRIALTSPLFAAGVTKAAAETGVECLVTDADFDTLVRATEPLTEVAERADGDTAVILCTTGTTGTPKGAELTHRNLSTNAVTTAQTLIRIGPDDVLFGGLPLFHAFGQTCALNAAVERDFGVTVLEGYGLSETSPVAVFNPPDRPRKAGSIGVPVRGVEARLVAEDGTAVASGDVGEIAIRGENVMKGSRNPPEATAEAVHDGWFHTGDLARVDEDGYYFIVDRRKDLIIRGGYNVYPREIEEVLYEHPAVAEAAVVGVPHDVHGEEIAAVVALRDDAEATADEIRHFVRERVAAYKYPRIVTFTDALPKGATGKILKREIVVGERAVTGPHGGQESGS